LLPPQQVRTLACCLLSPSGCRQEWDAPVFAVSFHRKILDGPPELVLTKRNLIQVCPDLDDVRYQPLHYFGVYRRKKRISSASNIRHVTAICSPQIVRGPFPPRPRALHPAGPKTPPLNADHVCNMDTYCSRRKKSLNLVGERMAPFLVGEPTPPRKPVLKRRSRAGDAEMGGRSVPLPAAIARRVCIEQCVARSKRPQKITCRASSPERAHV